MNKPIEITQEAAAQIKEQLEKAPEGIVGLRLSIKTTGCSGNSYKMEFIHQDDSKNDDELFEDNGAALYIPKIYSWMLFGTKIDYIEDELGNSRFDFINPNEASRCGCGLSFQVDQSASENENA